MIKFLLLIWISSSIVFSPFLSSPPIKSSLRQQLCYFWFRWVECWIEQFSGYTHTHTEADNTVGINPESWRAWIITVIISSSHAEVEGCLVKWQKYHQHFACPFIIFPSLTVSQAGNQARQEAQAHHPFDRINSHKIPNRDTTISINSSSQSSIALASIRTWIILLWADTPGADKYQVESGWDETMRLVSVKCIYSRWHQEEHGTTDFQSISHSRIMDRNSCSI